MTTNPHIYAMESALIQKKEEVRLKKWQTIGVILVCVAFMLPLAVFALACFFE